MPKRAGIRDGEQYSIAGYAQQGYTPEEVGHIMGIQVDVVKNFWPQKKTTRAKKAVPDAEK